ncbi:GspE/PulE family protein [Brucepastera parasyntrophica]|uniref:GspE/PulE family protein n=1 Tax=Brucepastera parasyntrophica TaxID=2880008 RepID=UPI00210E0225|nr:GspE/PulE family protein [Brucepastera parasyntrophica]ULQ59089.1 GspE/PulE family protein [Brucepastera parasyntrophica]
MAEASVSLERYYPLPDGPAQYPLEFIEAKGAIKLREDEGRVEIGLTEKADDQTKNTIRNFHKKEVVFLSINMVELSAYLGKKLGEDDRAEKTGLAIGTDERVLLDKLANDAPIINLVNSICIEGIRSGASDIHIEAGTEKARVRYRIDGVLRTIRTIDSNRFPAISSRIKIMANLNILERRQPQDGRITVSVGEENVDFRVSIIPVAGGESIVLRILGKKAAAGTLDNLGFSRPQLTTLRKLLRIPHGLILLTGPTGSGKTTTLNAMLGEIVSDTLKVIAIEDPVEFIVEGVNQIQINEQIGLGFDVLLRRVLRQDPNVIMIGEIRDTSTAEIAVRAALTGHLVLSTLHTNDSVSAIPRLINMGIEPYLIASVLKGVAAQRLVRKLCPHCAKAVKPSEAEQNIFKRSGMTAKKLYTAGGCGACDNTGYTGRTIIAELFSNDSGLEELIMRRENLSSLNAYVQQNGMTTLLQEGLRKASEGITTLREIEREITLPGGDD